MPAAAGFDQSSFPRSSSSPIQVSVCVWPGFGLEKLACSSGLRRFCPGIGVRPQELSGDDDHAIQRAFLVEFPDRRLRREHIRKNVFAQWLEIPDTDRMLAVERVLIWLHRPPWNRM